MFWGAGALRRNDAAGCIISGELSYTLFGSRHTTGSVVTVLEKSMSSVLSLTRRKVS